MNCCQMDARTYFLFCIRIFFGTWLLYVGLVKWFSIGPAGFIGFITAEFDKTWSPHLLNVFLGWVIIIAEPLLALFILSGRSPRVAWSMVALLMFMLVIGQTILMKPDVVGNWQYLILALACGALSDPVKCTPRGEAS